ncbi:MAG TPA: hypothetical protein VGR92_06070 [Steroidobacteraceae bacterium]|nr:hypothetical protein [Steroidobacteraceae bacterium]
MATEPTSKDGDKLEQILNILGVVRTGQDALKASHEALGARVSAMETADKARKDAEEKGRVDADARAETEERERADAVAREQRDETQKFIDTQRTVDEIAQAFGDSAGAPRWMHGESHDDYTRRILTKYKPYSKSWKDVDLTHINGSGLTVATKQIRADAVAAAALPEFQEGRLIERTSRDQYGRTVTKFYGDARVANAPFSYGGLIRRVRLTPVNELLAMRRG